MHIRDFVNPNYFYIHLTNFFINILYIFTCIQYAIYNVYNFINKKILKLYDEHFDKEILKIEYINEYGDKYIIYDILCDFTYFINCLLYKANDIDHREFKCINSLYKIISLLENDRNGLIVIDIYKNQEHNKIIINLDYLYNSIDIYNLINILTIINSFLFHKLNKDIINIQIEDENDDNEETQVNITNEFFLYSYSYCNDNITVQNLINVINILKNKNYNEYKQIKITDNNLNETIYKSNKYLNL